MSGLLPFTMLSEVGPEDALQSFIDKAGKVNVVNSSITTPNGTQYTLKDYVERYVWEIIVRCKQRRRPLEDEWLAIQRMTVLTHDDGQRYKGRSNAYLPVYARNRKTLVTKLSKALFPSDEFIDAEDEEGGDGEDAQAAKAVVKYELDNSGLRRTIKNFLGQFVDFGVSCIKGSYRTERILKGRKPKKLGEMNGQAVMDDGLDIGYNEGFQASTRSMFNVVVYPETAESKRELQLEAERMEVPLSYIQAMHDEKRWENVPEALAHGSGGTDDFDWVNMATLNDVASIPGTFELRGTDNSPVESVIVVEAWCKLKLPADQYAPMEDNRRPVPCRVVFVNGVAVMVRRNPLYHQCSPLEYARDNQIVGSFYADGAGRMTKDTQYLANDFVNQCNDAGIFGMNPIALVNTNYFSGKIGTYRPGGTYSVRDVDKAIKFVDGRPDIIQYGYQMVDRMVTFGQDGSGAPAVQQGSKAASTATASQLLQHNSGEPLQDTAEDIEADVMVPLACMAWELSRQYRTQPFIRAITGGKPAIDPMTGAPIMDPVTGQPKMVPDLASFLPSDITAKIRFKFLSSSQAVNRQARQQGVMVFTDLALKLTPNLQAQGLMLAPKPILEKVWCDGLGFRGFDKILIPAPMGPPGIPPPGGPGGPGGPGPMPQGPNVGGPPASTVPQANVPGTAGNEPVPGEGEEVNNVMANTQAQNAEAGQYNTPSPGPGLGGDILPY